MPLVLARLKSQTVYRQDVDARLSGASSGNDRVHEEKLPLREGLHVMNSCCFNDLESLDTFTLFYRKNDLTLQ